MSSTQESHTERSPPPPPPPSLFSSSAADPNRISDAIDRAGDDDDCTYDRSSYQNAAAALLRADYLLILAGAGMSADSGLETYETMPERYRELCDPSRLLADSSKNENENATNEVLEFQRFWFGCAQKYASTRPHRGYDILDRWCRTLERLSKKQPSPATTTKAEANPTDLSDTHKWWVYTSNVDGHFHRYPSFDWGSSHGSNNRSCEKDANNNNNNDDDDDDDDAATTTHVVCSIHGHAGSFCCSSGIGYVCTQRIPQRCAQARGRQRRRMGASWDRWNDRAEAVRTDRCFTATHTNCFPEGKKKYDDDEKNRSHRHHINDNDNDNDGVLRCQRCRTTHPEHRPLPLRPRVLLFHDTDDNVLGPVRAMRDRYQSWEAGVEDKVAHRSKRLVVLEIGCGLSVPVVRRESQEVLCDVLELLRIAQGSTPDNGRNDGDGDDECNGNNDSNGHGNDHGNDHGESEQPRRGGPEEDAVTLIRINPKDAGWDGEPTAAAASRLVSVFDTALRGLERIDRELELLWGLE